MKKPETILQDKITELLDNLIKQGEPIIYEKRTTRGFSYRKGRPDLWISLMSVHIEVELKDGDKGERSSMQIKFEEKCKRTHTIYWLITNFEEFERKLKIMLDAYNSSNIFI